MAYIIGVLQENLELCGSSWIVDGHEERVDEDADGDEEFDERIQDEEGHVMLQLEPAGTA